MFFLVYLIDIFLVPSCFSITFTLFIFYRNLWLLYFHICFLIDNKFLRLRLNIFLFLLITFIWWKKSLLSISHVLIILSNWLLTNKIIILISCYIYHPFFNRISLTILFCNNWVWKFTWIIIKFFLLSSYRNISALTMR